PGVRLRRMAVLGRARCVERWIVEIAGDKTRRETERSRALHHQQRLVATGAAASLQRRRRRLCARLEAHGVLEGLLDALAHARQHRERLLATLAVQELARPAADRGVGVGIVP